MGIWDGPYTITVRINQITYLPPNGVYISSDELQLPVSIIDSAQISSEVDPVPEEYIKVKVSQIEVDEATEILEHKTKTKLKSIASVELKEVDNKPIYQVKGVREAKLLWIIPVDMAVTVNVDADSETAEIVHTPWWGFLTS